LNSRDFVTLFRGDAGTGKSYTSQEVYGALQRAGHVVEVIAPQRQQVMDLGRDGFHSAHQRASRTNGLSSTLREHLALWRPHVGDGFGGATIPTEARHSGSAHASLFVQPSVRRGISATHTRLLCHATEAGCSTNTGDQSVMIKHWQEESRCSYRYAR
jgi:hypothetical protein